MTETRKKAEPEKGSDVETRTVKYLPAGVAPDLTPQDAYLDPALEKIRDEEIKRNEKVPAFAPLEEPTIDPELVEAREKERERDAKRAGVSDTSSEKSAAKKSAPGKAAASSEKSDK